MEYLKIPIKKKISLYWRIKRKKRNTVKQIAASKFYLGKENRQSDSALCYLQETLSIQTCIMSQQKRVSVFLDKAKRTQNLTKLKTTVQYITSYNGRETRQTNKK